MTDGNMLYSFLKVTGKKYACVCLLILYGRYTAGMEKRA